MCTWNCLRSRSSALLLALSLVGCGALDDGSKPSSCVDRVAICADELADDGFSALTDNGLYLPQPGAKAAAHSLSGTLSVDAVRMSASGREPAGRYGFPSFSVQFVTLGDVLLPLEREIIRGGSNDWNIILSPGRVWSEPNDGGMSRASFPFTLVTDE